MRDVAIDRAATSMMAAREASGRVPRGPNAVSDLNDAFKRVGSYNDYREWRENRITQLFIRALRTMTFVQPPGLSGDEASAQYGVTSGLSLAGTLLDDVSAVFPSCFSVPDGAEDEAGGMPDADYTQPAL